MMRRLALLAVGVCAVLAAFVPEAGRSGGPFERLIGVGAGGAWRAIDLAPTGPRSDAALFAGGQRVRLPATGYVRLFPTISSLNGIPGRYYPRERAVCWSWREPARVCHRLAPVGVRLLAPLARLPLRRAEPTTVVSLSHEGRRVPGWVANVLVAVELAFERGGTAASQPQGGFTVSTRWRGPAAAERPRVFRFTPAGIYARGTLYRLDKRVFAFARAQLAGVARTAASRGLQLPAPLYGIRDGEVKRVNPTTFERVGRGAPLAGHHFAWSFAPDRSRVVLGSDGSAELRFIDLRTMRVLGDAAVAARGSVHGTFWAGPGRVLAVVVTPGCCGLGDTIVAGVDIARRLLWQRRLGGSLQAGARFRRSFVLVLGPRGRALGSSRLVVVSPSGRVRSASLGAIQSGSHASGGGGHPARFVVRSWNPGLAIDDGGHRAFVVQAGAPVAEVDLISLRVRYRELAEPISLLGRLRDWLEPTARAKATEGPTREAHWLGNGLLAVTGSDTEIFAGRHGTVHQRTRPAGLKLIDTRRWSVRTLDATSTRAVFAGGTLLSATFAWDAELQRTTGSGLTGYARSGARRFHLFGSRPIVVIEPIGRYVYLGNAFVDARTGRIVRRQRLNFLLVAGDQPLWY